MRELTKPGSLLTARARSPPLHEVFPHMLRGQRILYRGLHGAFITTGCWWHPGAGALLQPGKGDSLGSHLTFAKGIGGMEPKSFPPYLDEVEHNGWTGYFLLGCLFPDWALSAPLAFLGFYCLQNLVWIHEPKRNPETLQFLSRS